MSKRKDQHKVRLVDSGVQDAERTLKVINDLKHEFHSTEKKLRLTYKQNSAANTEKHSARGVQSSWSGPASSFDRVDLQPTDSTNGDGRSVPPSQFSILHSDRAEVPRAHWVDQEIPSRDFDRCDSVDSAKTFTVHLPTVVTASRRRPYADADADGLPSTPTFKFVDAPMPVVPPTPAMARQILTKFPKDSTASWVAVESPETLSKAPAWPGTTPRDLAPCDLARPNGVAPFALRPDGVEKPVNGPTPPRPTIIRKSMKFVDWDQVEEPLAPVQTARLARWDGTAKPVQKRKSMKFVEPPEVHQDVGEGKGEECAVHASGQGRRPVVVRKKSVVDPATVLASYPGFCDVRDLDKKRRPKVHLDVIQSQRTKPEAPIRGAHLNNQLAKAESEFAPRKKSTITPSTWREERKKLNAKVQKEKLPVNTEQPNGNGAHETEPNDNSPSHTIPKTNSPSTPKEEESPKPIKRFKPRPPKVEEREPREKSPPKVKRYDVEETREFIERQKQLRLAKLAKEKENKQALKETIAMKLKALQEKQLQLVRANVEARLAKKSASRRRGGQRRSGPEASTQMASPRRYASSPLHPPAVGLASPRRHSNREIDRMVHTFTDNLNQDQLSRELAYQSPRQAIVISNSPPEKLEKPTSVRSSPAAPYSHSETEINPNEAQRNVDAQLLSKHSNIVNEFYSEMQKMDSNTAELRSADLSRQMSAACNDLSQSLAASRAAQATSARRNDGSTVHLHRNITARSARAQVTTQGGLSSVLDYDRKRKRNQAATKIQAAFRGYRVRKMKENSAKSRKQYEFFNDPDRSFDSDVSEGPLSDSGTNNEENVKQANGFEFDFRHYHLQPQPNNFISAVKQKLKMHRNARNNCWVSPPRQKVPNSQVKNIPGDVKKSNSKEAIIPANESPRIIPAPQKTTKSYSQDCDDTFASSIISMVNGSSSTHSKASIIPSYVNDLKTGNSESTKNLIIPKVGLVRKRANDGSTPRTISEDIFVSTSDVASSQRGSHSKQTPPRHLSEGSKTRKSLDVLSSENLSSVQEILSSSGNGRDDDDDDDDDDFSHSFHRQREQRVAGRGSSLSVPVDSSRLQDHRQNVHTNLNNGRLYPADALHMQFQAELNLLDSVDESRRQLLEVEKLRAVNFAQQGTSSLAHALKVAQQKHEEHLSAVERKQAFEEALQRERLELQNFFKDALKNQTLLRKSSSESSKITASAHSSNDAGKSSVPEVLESNRDSGEEIELSIHGSSINASMSENIEDESSRTESVSDLEMSSLDITRKMKLHIPHLGTSVNATSDLACLDRTAQNGGASMAKFSFHLLEQLVRDEELRVQHQMSLLKLQDKTLTEKTKAEMAWLEVKKRQLRGKGMENQMSAIKKKQRGLILKLQQDKEELARLKETQRIASDERKIMLRSQQHALRMDLAAQNAFHRVNPLTNGNQVMAIPLNHSKPPSEIASEHRSRSNGGKSRDATLVETDLQQSDVPEEISLKESRSDMTVSTQSPAEHSTDTKVDVQYLEQLVLDGLKKLDKNKRFLNEQAKELQLRREAVEKSLAQRKRLADEERKVQELEAQESAMALTNNVVQKQIRSFRDTSTSPFQTMEKQDSRSTISEHIVNSEASAVQSAIDLDVKSSSSHPVTMVDKSTSASVATDNNYIDESFESAVSSEANSNATALNQETHSKSSLVKRSSSERMPNPVLSIKASLSPLMTNIARRRHSSGSDDSIIYSQTETTSEQSDAEGRITALNEQLKRRMLEAERLRREQKRLNRERLSCKEQTLLKQIQEYDKIIARAKQDIELEHDNHQSVSIVRPKIKQPRVAEKKQSNDAGHSATSQHVPLDNSLRKVREDVNETENVSGKIPSESLIAEALSTATEVDSLPTTTDGRKVAPEISDKSSNSAMSVSERIDDVSDGNVSETESRKSLSEDTSAETTIHSLVPSSKSDAQDKKEDSKESTSEETPRPQKDEESKVKVSRDTLEQREVEDDVISAASSADCNSADTSQGLLEDLDENSGSHTSGVIKIFLDEKVPAIATPVVEEVDSTAFEVTGINDTGISEGPLEDEFLVQEQETEHDSLDGPALLNETFVVERQAVDVAAQLKALTVDRLTDSILHQLLVECTTPPQKRNKVARDVSPEKQDNTPQAAAVPAVKENQVDDENERNPDKSVGVADLLLYECLKECTTHMMVLHKKRTRRNASPSNVRRRVHEIMAETASSSHRSAKRPQDLMISTYDVLSGEEETPPDTPACLSSDNSFDNDYLDDQAKSPVLAMAKVDLGVALSPSGESGSADTDGFTQEWFDEDFGLGTTHTKREAAELRIQQLQIEQEIQQLQQAQEQIPYFYIREIPNKPPPPYTPPGQSPPRPGSRTSPESRRRQSRNVTASQEETASLAASATDYLYAAVTEGADLNLFQPPDTYYESSTCDSRNTFKKFMFDLVKEIVKDAYDWEAKTWHPSWETPLPSNKRQKLKPRSKEMLQGIVQRKTLLYLGFVQRSGKENMIMSWGRKKRDFVDELLMQEAHEEEDSWINYDEDETNLKNDITLAILQSLINESVQVFRNIQDRRLKKQINLS